jgi:lactate permease
LVAAFGAGAPFASPLLAIISGFFAGTNVGSNSAMMPLQAALGRASGLGPITLPAIQNGTLALVISPQLTAVAAGLAGEVTLGAIWRIMWPVALITLLVGLVSIGIG